MRLPFTVEPQQFPPIIIPIRRPEHGMNMVLHRVGVQEHNPRVVVKLDKHYGTLHAVVEAIVVAVFADPAEVRLAHVLSALVEAGVPSTLRQQFDETVDDVDDLLLLSRGHVGGYDAFVRNDAIVLESPS